jgi:hypothetical protein
VLAQPGQVSVRPTLRSGTESHFSQLGQAKCSRSSFRAVNPLAGAARSAESALGRLPRAGFVDGMAADLYECPVRSDCGADYREMLDQEEAIRIQAES